MSSEDKDAPQWLVDCRKRTFNDCHVLYKAATYGQNNSCMSFGWECGDGWNAILAKLSYECEILNLQFYKKYGIRIQADQVKEKYGTLRFYYSIQTDPPKILTLASRAFYGLYELIRRNVDFKYKTVVDSPRHKEHIFEEITQSKYDASIARDSTYNHVEYIDGGDRKFYVIHADAIEKIHKEPSVHRILHAIMRTLKKISTAADMTWMWNPSREHDVIVEYLDNKVEELVRKAEDECYSVCERCGQKFDERHPRCETTGWISYMCEKHAAAGGGTYIKNDRKFRNFKECE